MPNINDDSTVEAVARAFTSNGRVKMNALMEVGYNKRYSRTCGLKIYDNIRVKAAIARIDAKTWAKSVKSRKQRQEFWSDVMETAPNMSDKLRASELLGKSEADFTETVINRSEDTTEPLSATERTAAVAAAKAVTGPKLAKEA